MYVSRRNSWHVKVNTVLQCILHIRVEHFWITFYDFMSQTKAESFQPVVSRSRNLVWVELPLTFTIFCIPLWELVSSERFYNHDMIISLNFVSNKNKNDLNFIWKSQSLSHRFRPGGNCKSCSQQSQRCLWFVEGHLSCPSALSWHEPASRADEGLLQPPLLLLHRLFLQDPLRRAWNEWGAL